MNRLRGVPRFRQIVLSGSIITLAHSDIRGVKIRYRIIRKHTDSDIKYIIIFVTTDLIAVSHREHLP